MRLLMCVLTILAVAALVYDNCVQGQVPLLEGHKMVTKKGGNCSCSGVNCIDGLEGDYAVLSCVEFAHAFCESGHPGCECGGVSTNTPICKIIFWYDGTCQDRIGPMASTEIRMADPTASFCVSQ